MPTADTPVPRQFSEEERAMDAFDDLLVDYACAIRVAMQVGDFPNMGQKGLDADEHAARTAVYSAHSALLTALASEREAGERDKARLDWLEASLRPLPWGGVFALIESDGDSQFRLTMQPASGDAPFLNETGATLRDAIDASRATANDGDCHDCGTCAACIERTESNYLDACAALDDSTSTETPHE